MTINLLATKVPKRYSIDIRNEADGGVYVDQDEDPDGEWVRISELEDFLNVLWTVVTIDDAEKHQKETEAAIRARTEALSNASRARNWSHASDDVQHLKKVATSLYVENSRMNSEIEEYKLLLDNMTEALGVCKAYLGASSGATASSVLAQIKQLMGDNGVKPEST